MAQIMVESEALDSLKRMVEELEIEKNSFAAALQAIAYLHPEKDSKEGFNEWGEADCFNQAQSMARKTLGMNE